MLPLLIYRWTITNVQTDKQINKYNMFSVPSIIVYNKGRMNKRVVERWHKCESKWWRCTKKIFMRHIQINPMGNNVCGSKEHLNQFSILNRTMWEPKRSTKFFMWDYRNKDWECSRMNIPDNLIDFLGMSGRISVWKTENTIRNQKT